LPDTLAFSGQYPAATISSTKVGRCFGRTGLQKPSVLPNHTGHIVKNIRLVLLAFLQDFSEKLPLYEATPRGLTINLLKFAKYYFVAAVVFGGKSTFFHNPTPVHRPE
jgi:hypothetical protein